MTILLTVLMAISTPALVFAAMTVKGHREYRATVNEIIKGNHDEIIDLLEKNYELAVEVKELQHNQVPKILRLDEIKRLR